MKVNIGDDFEVDPALSNDCNAEINKRCMNVKKGEGRLAFICFFLFLHKFNNK